MHLVSSLFPFRLHFKATHYAATSLKYRINRHNPFKPLLKLMPNKDLTFVLVHHGYCVTAVSNYIAAHPTSMIGQQFSVAEAVRSSGP